MPKNLSKSRLSIKAVLSRNPETVPQFVDRTSCCSKADKLAEMQKYLLGSLQNVSRVGTYSNWWLASVYKNGYSHPDTIFLAYMFTNVLDGAKTGITVSSKRPSRGRNEYYNNDEIPAKRNPELPPFTLELLHCKLTPPAAPPAAEAAAEAAAQAAALLSWTVDWQEAACVLLLRLACNVVKSRQRPCWQV
ncbi:hypothetical protein EVJ58_g10137 [Rhodofomes roseus]|uniref:RNA-dependent RNA polymerase n=1 Tax=Rhodofomes roseus TaxID=34475 RepID=A0A4Y9XR34_9APHY|nr:hypothetical protein EVJ58_g10137 [Rhodofomes roseus]